MQTISDSPRSPSRLRLCVGRTCYNKALLADTNVLHSITNLSNLLVELEGMVPQSQLSQRRFRSDQLALDFLITLPANLNVNPEGCHCVHDVEP